MHPLLTLLLKKSKISILLGLCIGGGILCFVAQAQVTNKSSEDHYNIPDGEDEASLVIDEEKEWEDLGKELKNSRKEEILSDPNTAKKPTEHYGKKAKLHILNKITARRTAFTVDIHETTLREKLKITMDSCIMTEELGKQEHAALIEIWEESVSGFTKRLFHGWLFKNSPSLSGLEHPLYDVIMVECIP